MSSPDPSSGSASVSVPMTASIRPQFAAEVGAFTSYQRFVIALLAALQFTIVLDFMIIAPLGAIVMPVLHITPEQFGLIVSAYAFGAGAAGIVTAGFADRFDRRKLLLLIYGGFIGGTLLCALASSYASLLLGRIVTGLFAGVVGSVSFAIVTDLFTFEQRGRVMGVIQTAFGASSVLGIPLGLMLATHWHWNMPFYLIGTVSLIVISLIATRMQPVTEHLRQQTDRSAGRHLLHTLLNPWYLQGFMTTCLLSIGGFTLMPFMSAFVVNNVGIPVERLPLVYITIGALAVVAGPFIGRLSDTLGKFPVFAAGCALTIVMVLIYTRLGPTPLWRLVAIMGAVQVGVFSRMISSSALISAVPAARDRGAYMAIGSSVQQMAGGIAAVLAGYVVVQTTQGTLRHYDLLGDIVVLTTLISLTLMFLINRRIALRGPGVRER
jgi:predicted MFS family arabinose efflux permease